MPPPLPLHWATWCPPHFSPQVRVTSLRLPLGPSRLPPPPSSNSRGGWASLDISTAATTTDPYRDSRPNCQRAADTHRARQGVPLDTVSPGPLRCAKRRGSQIEPAARPGKRLRQQSMRYFLSHSTHVSRTQSSTSTEHRPVRRNRKRKRTRPTVSSSLTGLQARPSRQSAVKSKKPRTMIFRTDTDTDSNQTVLRQDSEPPTGTDCLGANFPT